MEKRLIEKMPNRKVIQIMKTENDQQTTNAYEMNSCHIQINLLNHRLVEIDSTPDLRKTRPAVIHKQEEIGKLIKQLEIMRETWIALKFNDEIFVVWKDLVFLYLKENRENKPSTE